MTAPSAPAAPSTISNFLPQQYRETGALPINHNYLQQQFADAPAILSKIAELVHRGDFTLGAEVDRFEARICGLTGSRHAIGVGSGTDAIFLSLKAAGIGPGDEVITTPYTFFATVGAIATTGARPVFADAAWDYNIDPAKIEAVVTPRTRAIVPVHWSGFACRMEEILAIANRHNLVVVEDSCHGIRASLHGKPLGTFGLTGCFSMHPLKNLNVWGDGGYIVTDSDEMADKLRLMRNHGLINRNEAALWGYNSRLDTLQAIVANHLLDRIDPITDARIAHAARYDAALASVSQVTIPPRPADVKQVYHIYVLRAQRRDELVAHLVARGIDAKVHYPKPMHLQPASAAYGYREGDFPVAEELCRSVFSLPVHEFITDEQIDSVTAAIKEFYARG
jgi:dTDP-4-amino-4,6-dideoxygalactose transaminase